MITTSEMYWLTRLDGIQGFFIAMTILIAIYSTLAILIGGGEGIRKLFWSGIVCGVISILFSVGAILTPTTKQMCAIKIIPLVLNDPNVQEIPEQLLNLKDAWIEELKPKKD